MAMAVAGSGQQSSISIGGLRHAYFWTQKVETQRQIDLSLHDWISEFGNKHRQKFVPRAQEDGTTKWTMRSELYIFN